MANVVMNRTPRYHGHFPWKKAVTRYGEQAVFVGLPDQHKTFVKNFGFVPTTTAKTCMNWPA